MSNQRKHRPPHSMYAIDEMLKLGLFDDAQAACEANVEFYEARANEYRDKYVEAQVKRVEATAT